MEHIAVSLFSGAGGLDIGLEQAGFHTAICQEWDPVCCQTLTVNGKRVLQGDIRELTPDQLLQEAGIERAQVALVYGGPPCQPFSTAGKKQGIRDPRGSLFRDFVRFVDDIRPRFFLMENVQGLTSSYIPNSDQTAYDIICSEFLRIGYTFSSELLNAADFGVPQARKRMIFMGSRDNEPIHLPKPNSEKQQTLRDAVYDLKDDPGLCAEFSPSRLKFLRMVPEGGNWRSLPEEVLDEAMGGARHSGGGKVGFYRRLGWDKPCPTLVTSPIQKATMLCHPEYDRPLSVREYARIQQFPDNWVFCGRMMEQYRQIGNAVPVGLGKAIGEAFWSCD